MPLALLHNPPLHRRLALATAALLATVAVVHLLDGPGTLSEHFYVGALELALAAALLPLAVLLVARPVPALWLAGAGLCGASLVLYVASRTVGLPGSTDDIGNWAQALGVVSVLAEAGIIGLAARALAN